MPHTRRAQQLLERFVEQFAHLAIEEHNGQTLIGWQHPVRKRLIEPPIVRLLQQVFAQPFVRANKAIMFGRQFFFWPSWPPCGIWEGNPDVAVPNSTASPQPSPQVLRRSIEQGARCQKTHRTEALQGTRKEETPAGQSKACASRKYRTRKNEKHKTLQNFSFSSVPLLFFGVFDSKSSRISGFLW